MSIFKRTTINTYIHRSGDVYVSVNGKLYEDTRLHLRGSLLRTLSHLQLACWVIGRPVLLRKKDMAKIRKSSKLYTSIIIHSNGRVFRDGRWMGNLKTLEKYLCLIPK